MKNRLRSIGFALAAPVAAFVLATVLSGFVLLLAGSNPITAFGDMLKHGAKLETHDRHAQQGDPVVLVGRCRCHRLQDGPLQHRRRRPISVGRVLCRRRRWGSRASRRDTRALHHSCRHDRRRSLGRVRRVPQGHLRRQRGDLDDHVERHRHGGHLGLAHRRMARRRTVDQLGHQAHRRVRADSGTSTGSSKSSRPTSRTPRN